MKRKTLFDIHFYFSSFFTPFLILMAVTGTSYLFGYKGSTVSTEIKTGISLASDKEAMKKQISDLIKRVDANYRFEALKDRGPSIQTRPSTRDFYNFKKRSDGLFTLYKVRPDILSRLIEVHKGHGPKLLKNLQKLLGVALFFIVITGFLMSLKIKARLKHFLGTISLGTMVLVALFFL